MSLRVREMIFREGENEAADQAGRNRLRKLAGQEERSQAANDKSKDDDRVMDLNLSHESHQDNRDQAVERIQRVRQQRRAVRIVEERRVPRRLV